MGHRAGARGTGPLAAIRLEGRGAPRRWVLFLHGIFGAGRNWRTVGRRLIDRRRDWNAALLDLRLHGSSQEFRPPHTVAACADDVVCTAHSLGAAETVLVGHSFGGKVALAAAHALPGLVATWVIDSDPGAGAPRGDAPRMLEALREFPGPFARREEAIEALVGRGFAPAVAAWMATNLEERDAVLAWRLDAERLAELLADFYRTDVWSAVERPPDGRPIHFVKAVASDVLASASVRRLERLGAAGVPVAIHAVAGGHWLNADNPDALVELLAEGLPSPRT